MLTLQDDIEIRNLVATYADAVGAKDLESWKATWAQDAVWQIGDRIMEGIDDVVGFMESALARFPQILQTAFSGKVDMGEDGRPTGVWPVLEIQHVSETEEQMLIGRYEDVYTHESGRWVFATRRFQALYRGPVAPGMQAR